MKFATIACAASLASLANAATHYVTRYHYVTVGPDGNVVGSDVSVAPQPSGSEINKILVVTSSGDSLSTFVPTTLKTVTGSYSSISTTVADTSVTSSPASTSTPASSSSNDSGDISSANDPTWAKEILDLHNEKRALHSAPALTWDADVYAYAQAYADKFTCGGSLKHSGGQYGENLALGFSTAETAFEAWYSEGDNYDYSTASSFDHFTAVIWKSTTKLGCAYKECDQGRYTICSYDPAGNVVGAGLQNLFSS
ncbi:CIC11C00000003622 [Sungouiella intermedia]|uniref:CIC11C00000002757 n=1 Tax=Sungouiella intermedia TaxID=45354 RepID=A0A1L0DG67_9ASCO|nr:CIC11C00000002757 [[Candida] intermedia]SGZ55508.1 CIC11C00000003622 [[Candida] intermedia]